LDIPHKPYIQRISGKLLINAGSVGRSREDDRKASFHHLRLHKKRIEAEIVKVDYDINFVAQQIYASEIPDF
jgi:predicted phosphodiesterase